MCWWCMEFYINIQKKINLSFLITSKTKFINQHGLKSLFVVIPGIN